jgi:hypothetical protein
VDPYLHVLYIFCGEENLLYAWSKKVFFSDAIVFMLYSFLSLQRIGQFVISTSDLTPQVLGAGGKDNSMQHPSAKLTAVRDV